MDASAGKPQFAWQPLTPRGVAAFAQASLGRLLLVQFIFALLATAIVVWFAHRAWFPTISEAIGQLPSQGAIRAGALDWRGDSPARLAEGRFLAFSVDLQHEGRARSPAHVQIEFGQADFKIFSLFGFVENAYPQGKTIAFNRPELEPWWGAWKPPISALVAASVLAGLMLSWAVLAMICFLPAWLVGFFTNRSLSLGGSWRLAGAAQMPGALFLTAAIFCYGLGMLDPLRLVLAAGLHFVSGWIYILLAPLSLPRHPDAAPTVDPFVAPSKEEEEKPRT